MADVILYRSQEDYTNGVQAYQTMTNDMGVAKFVNIPAESYYIVANLNNKSNILGKSNQPIDGKFTGWYISGVFQTQAEIESRMPDQLNASVGDFRWQDLNSDGVINAEDKGFLPKESATVADGSLASVEILIGLEKNTVPTMTEGELKTAINNIAVNIALWHKQFVVLDASLSNQVVTDTIPALAVSFQGIGNYSFRPNTQIIGNLWNNGYQAITGLNHLEDIASASISNSETLLAQIKALRAYAYLQLLTYFGNIPLMQTADQQINPSNRNRNEVLQYLTDELGQAATKLPARTTNTNDLTAAAVKGLQARLALLSADYTITRDLTSAIVNGGQYSLSPTTTMYSANSSEIIWDYSSNMPAAIKAFFYGRPTLPYLRLTEVYLMQIEADINLGNIQEATQLFNILLNRRGLPQLTSVSRNDLQARWFAEMNKEGISFPAIVRWNIAGNLLGQKGYQAPKNERLPIPQAFIDNYSDMIQNPGY